MQKWTIEVIRYDKGKKVQELDYVDADAYRVDDHNNLILHHIPDFDDVPVEDMLIVKMYHGYNWISIAPYKEE